ncbi:alanine racemase [Rhodosalinus sediminis]|uniref:alanine racemase n=1 Tax=Rhodosalinus sediminis TaxID=1940533 RepID=UPI002357F020|nr:alanine racemase [Rhodosalinus sediminis]
MTRMTDIAPDVADLARAASGRPCLVFDAERLTRQARRFRAGFPGLVTYAVKANPLPEVLRTLARAGIGAFDVASPAEMEAVRAAVPGAVLHYHNPLRAPEEVAAGARHGAVSWSVDDAPGLDRLAPLKPGTEVAVRLRLPVRGGAYDFGEKFGADPEAAAALLGAVAARGFAPSLTFHPGTQCGDPEAWAAYIRAAAGVAGAAGVRLHRLNVGGGFPHGPDGDGALEAIFARIAAETRAAFGAAAPALVCEPGRAMVAGAFGVLARVKALRGDGAVVLTDGIYGALAEWRDVPRRPEVAVLDPAGRPRGAPQRSRVVFGPTCDSIDRLPEPLALPGDIAEGDAVLFAGMGAYSAALATRFNGYGDLSVVEGRLGD